MDDEMRDAADEVDMTEVAIEESVSRLDEVDRQTEYHLCLEVSGGT